MPAHSPAEPPVAVRGRSEAWFADDRGLDRRLKVSWHPAHRLFVLSVWHHDTCVATVRLPVGEVPRLIAALADGLGSAVTRTASTIAGRAAGRSRRRSC